MNEQTPFPNFLATVPELIAQVLHCSEEDQKMPVKWLVQLSFANGFGQTYCGLGWLNGEVFKEAIGQ